MHLQDLVKLVSSTALLLQSSLLPVMVREQPIVVASIIVITQATIITEFQPVLGHTKPFMVTVVFLLRVWLPPIWIVNPHTALPPARAVHARIIGVPTFLTLNISPDAALVPITLIRHQLPTPMSTQVLALCSSCQRRCVHCWLWPRSRRLLVQ